MNSVSEIVVASVPHDTKCTVCSDDRSLNAIFKFCFVLFEFDLKVTFILFLFKCTAKCHNILPKDIAITDSNSFLVMHDDSCTNVSDSRFLLKRIFCSFHHVKFFSQFLSKSSNNDDSDQSR